MFGGPRLGLLMAVGVLLLLLASNLQSFRLFLVVGLLIPAVIAGVVLMLWLTPPTPIILPAIFATLESRHARISASLDPDDPQSRYFESEPRLGSVSDRGDGRAEHLAHAAE